MSVNLVKGQKISLVKEGGGLKKVMVGLGWDEAWREVSGSVFYTNHTVLSEALEKWPQGLIQSLLPRVWEILCEIDRRSRASGGRDVVRDGQVRAGASAAAVDGFGL